MDSIFKGKIWKLGDDIDTDIIVPTEYLALPTVEDMKKFAFFPLRRELPGLIQKGDIIVGGKNFGCGSSREQAVGVLTALGVSCVIAKSFARIFYRNAFNNGLLLLESGDMPDICEEGDTVTVDLTRSKISARGNEYGIAAIPGELMEILNAGGLAPYMRRLNAGHNN